MTNYFENRRTIRKYTNRNIDESLLNSILKRAMRAPTTGNMQLYSVVVTRDIEMKRKLSPAHFNQPSVVDCSVLLTVCADFNRFVKWCDASNAVPGYDNFQSLISAMLDATIYAQQIVTIAETEGLGSCYLGTVTYNAPAIAEILELPKRVIPIACVTLGYADEMPQICERLPLEAICHNEKYCDYTAERIASLYKEKEELEVNRKFVSENNKQTLAQVFTDIRYNKKNNEAFSKIFIDFIRSQGFEMD